MNIIQQQVLEFHRAFGAYYQISPGFPPLTVVALRLKLINEEYIELLEAVEKRDLIGVADALGDLNYVSFGTALAFGLDMQPIQDEIHRSNMTKLGLDGKPIVREDGKIIKGPNFELPNLRKIISGV